MLDIHTHLHFSDYDNDRDEIVRRAREAGVTKMICVGTSPEDNEKAIEVAEKYNDIYVSVGIHPHFFGEGRIKELRKFVKHHKVIAIGESGLDYFSRDSQKAVTEEQKSLQKELFLAQIELAKELKLPLIVHTRPSAGSTDAYEDMFDILTSHISSAKGGQASLISHLSSHFILHCYQGDTEITKKFLEFPNVYFSFAGNITYSVKKAVVGTKDDLSEVVKLIPLERLFVETDCPYLAPEGKRGERNEPAYVLLTAQKICELKGIPMADLETALDKNFRRVFVRRALT